MMMESGGTAMMIGVEGVWILAAALLVLGIVALINTFGRLPAD